MTRFIQAGLVLSRFGLCAEFFLGFLFIRGKNSFGFVA